MSVEQLYTLQTRKDKNGKEIFYCNREMGTKIYFYYLQDKKGNVYPVKKDWILQNSNKIANLRVRGTTLYVKEVENKPNRIEEFKKNFINELVQIYNKYFPNGGEYSVFTEKEIKIYSPDRVYVLYVYQYNHNDKSKINILLMYRDFYKQETLEDKSMSYYKLTLANIRVHPSMFNGLKGMSFENCIDVSTNDDYISFIRKYPMNCYADKEMSIPEVKEYINKIFDYRFCNKRKPYTITILKDKPDIIALTGKVLLKSQKFICIKSLGKSSILYIQDLENSNANEFMLFKTFPYSISDLGIHASDFKKE